MKKKPNKRPGILERILAQLSKQKIIIVEFNRPTDLIEKRNKMLKENVNFRLIKNIFV